VDVVVVIYSVGLLVIQYDNDTEKWITSKKYVTAVEGEDFMCACCGAVDDAYEMETVNNLMMLKLQII
jgi:hypothetical protein